MMFSAKPGIVSFSGSNNPASHATMFGPTGKRLLFRPDASKFDDVARYYTWAFEYVPPLADGEEFIFATAECAILGEVTGGQIRIANRVATVSRAFDGKPLGVIDMRKSAHKLPTRRPGVLRAATPKVSVITCTYNRAEMLAEAIESMRAQTSRDWEHLILDNGSTDTNVRGVLEEAFSADERIRVYHRAPNIDQPARYWNDLVDLARGKYIGFLDDDNLKDPRFVAMLSGELDKHPEADMVTCGFLLQESGATTASNQLNLFTARDIFSKSTIDTGAFLIRREALERIGYFPLNIRTNEDWALMRRAATCLKMRHLDECLAIYRSHPGQRMRRCEALGDREDKAKIERMVWKEPITVAIHHPRLELLTASQQDVIDAASAGIRAIPWTRNASEKGETDIAVVFAPFRLLLAEAEALARRYHTLVLVHSEDPYASFANGERVEVMAKYCPNLWVAANDTASLSGYREWVGERVIACPSLSVDHRHIPKSLPWKDRPYDVLLVGYGYPARQAFVKTLRQHFHRPIKIRGNNWESSGFDFVPTARFDETAPMYGEAKTVLCFHRQEGDCGGAPHAARLVQRGYVEGAGGARVFLDTTRPDHAYEEGEVEWFEGPEELAEKLERFLKLSVPEQVALGEPLRERAIRDFTYRTRMARVLNAVRSLRYGAIIP